MAPTVDGGCMHPRLIQESVVLAKWLMGITLALAAQFPDDQHAQFLGAAGLGHGVVAVPG